jgi:predicted CoA-binding protein
LVIQPSIARKLLKLGYKIIDIKPQKQTDGTTDFTRCVFLFEKVDGLDKEIEILKSQQ